jgi:hypothetical protein
MIKLINTLISFNVPHYDPAKINSILDEYSHIDLYLNEIGELCLDFWMF